MGELIRLDGRRRRRRRRRRFWFRRRDAGRPCGSTGRDRSTSGDSLFWLAWASAIASLSFLSSSSSSSSAFIDCCCCSSLFLFLLWRLIFTFFCSLENLFEKGRLSGQLNGHKRPRHLIGRHEGPAGANRIAFHHQPITLSCVCVCVCVWVSFKFSRPPSTVLPELTGRVGSGLFFFAELYWVYWVFLLRLNKFQWDFTRLR